MQRWPEKRVKIEQRLKKNSYFHSGRNTDEKDLRLGKKRYTELKIYCSLEDELKELEDEKKPVKSKFKPTINTEEGGENDEK